MAEPVEIVGAGGAKFTVTPGLDPGYTEHFERQRENGEIREDKKPSAPARKPKPSPKAD